MTTKELSDKVNKKVDLPDVGEIVDYVPPIKDNVDVNNCIEYEGKLIEIKPTEIKYFANNSVAFYRILESTPLPQIFNLTEEKNGIDGCSALLVFLSAVLNDAKLAKRIYMSLDSAQIYKALEIFKRINRITELEDNIKKLEATKAKESN